MRGWELHGYRCLLAAQNSLLHPPMHRRILYDGYRRHKNRCSILRCIEGLRTTATVGTKGVALSSDASKDCARRLASAQKTSLLEPSFSKADKDFVIKRAVSLSLSMNFTILAPLDRASIPKAPLPENKSTHLALVRSLRSQSNKVSLILFPVGRTPNCSEKIIFLPFHLPPIILTLCL